MVTRWRWPQTNSQKYLWVPISWRLFKSGNYQIACRFHNKKEEIKHRISILQEDQRFCRRLRFINAWRGKPNIQKRNSIYRQTWTRKWILSSWNATIPEWWSCDISSALWLVRLIHNRNWSTKSRSFGNWICWWFLNDGVIPKNNE